MWMRWAGLAVGLALVGLVCGYGYGALTRAEPGAIAHPRPVAAVSPSVPVDPPPTFAPDIDYPPLPTGLDYRPHRIGDPPYFQWAYVAPAGWASSTTDSPDELRWRPPDEPTVGGFSLRVKVITERKTPEAMAEQKRTAVATIYDDVEILEETDDSLFFTYRDPGRDTQRFNMFRWFTAPGGTVADFEMSVVGRAVDEDGLLELRDRVAASVRKLP